MIDLRRESLPDTIQVGKLFFKIKTDFREWLKFDEIIKNDKCTLANLLFLFEEELKPGTLILHEKEIVKRLFEFYQNANITPKDTEKSEEVIVDYIQDGEYIVGSFMAEYGIDLTSINGLHWHMFKALFISLADTSKIKQIMSMRAYKKQDISYEKQSLKLKEAWRLPQRTIKQNQELLDEIDSELYNA